MAKGLLDRIIDSVFDDQWVGKRGEKLTERELKLVNLFGRKGKTLRNLYIPTDKGETSEIDLVYITQKGIFVFESKNYSGWIFGNEQSQNWTMVLPNHQKHRFYNPIKQNRTHIKWLDQFLGGGIPLFSIIVFSERCELKKVTVEDPDIKVIQRDYTYATVRKIWDASPDVLAEEAVEKLYEQLKKLTQVDEATKLAHVAAIKSKYQNEPEEPPQPVDPPQEATDAIVTESEAEEEIPEAPVSSETETKQETEGEEQLCPRCGKKLILRTAKKGANAGKQFYGCSGFPQCRYTRQI